MSEELEEQQERAATEIGFFANMSGAELENYNRQQWIINKLVDIERKLDKLTKRLRLLTNTWQVGNE